MVQLCQLQVAGGYTCIAESYMTVPMCDLPNAEELCEVYLNKALELNSENLDALQTMAHLKIFRKEDEEASKLLDKVVKMTLKLH